VVAGVTGSTVATCRGAAQLAIECVKQLRLLLRLLLLRLLLLLLRLAVACIRPCSCWHVVGA
jgi:hypothetical protein